MVLVVLFLWSPLTLANSKLTFSTNIQKYVSIGYFFPTGSCLVDYMMSALGDVQKAEVVVKST